MIQIYRRKAKRRYKEEKIKVNEMYYECKYRRMIMRSKEYINRSLYTDNPLMKKLYLIDDSIFLFDAVDAESFERERGVILDMVTELHNEFKIKFDNSVPGSVPNIVYSRRLQAFDSYYNKIVSVNLEDGLDKAIMKLKRIKVNLKPVIKR